MLCRQSSVGGGGKGEVVNLIDDTNYIKRNPERRQINVHFVFTEHRGREHELMFDWIK